MGNSEGLTLVKEDSQAQRSFGKIATRASREHISVVIGAPYGQRDYMIRMKVRRRIPAVSAASSKGALNRSPVVVPPRTGVNS